MAIEINGRVFILRGTDYNTRNAVVELVIPGEAHPLLVNKKIYTSRKGDYVRLRTDKNRHKRIYLEDFYAQDNN